MGDIAKKLTAPMQRQTFEFTQYTCFGFSFMLSHITTSQKTNPKFPTAVSGIKKTTVAEQTQH